MSARLEPFAPPRSTARRIARAVIITLLVLAGLVVGAIAGLFVADLFGWVPPISC